MPQSESRNEKIKKLLEEYTKKHSISQESARAALIASGIYDENGQLRPEYGGPEIKEEVDNSSK